MVIAILLMAAVSGVVFAMGRLFYLDTSLAGIYENSTVAYYAAESGIEEGLLRYRFDRNSEVPAENQPDFEYIRSNTATQSVGGIASFTSAGLDPVQEIYDLSMTYKQNFYGNDVTGEGSLTENDVADSNYDPGKIYFIPRDESVKIDISDVSALSSDLNMYFKPSDYASDFTYRNMLIEAKIIGTVGGKLNEYKKVLVDASNPHDFDANSIVKMTYSVLKGTFEVVNAKKNIAKSTAFDSGTTLYLYLKPIGAGVTFGIDPASSNDKIAGPYTTVKSTGYFGGTSRTLEAKIDRQSGTVYDLFDFVMYQHQ